MRVGRRFSCSKNGHREIVIHPLVGSGKVEGISIGGRKNIFDPFPGGLFGSSSMEIEATSDFDFILASYPDRSGPMETVTSAKAHMLGRGTARREVRETLGHGSTARHLRCGETVNRPGGWSSWPPHKFDGESPAGFDEVFYVFTDPRDGYGIMRINGELKEVRSGDRVEVPLGEHPIVAGPGVRLMYVWCFVGAEKLYPKWAEDLGSYR